MKDVLYLTKNYKNIVSSHNVICPKCQEKQFSAFDKLFTTANEICYMCAPIGEDTDILSDNIFSIIDSLETGMR